MNLRLTVSWSKIQIVPAIFNGLSIIRPAGSNKACTVYVPGLRSKEHNIISFVNTFLFDFVSWLLRFRRVKIKEGENKYKVLLIFESDSTNFSIAHQTNSQYRISTFQKCFYLSDYFGVKTRTIFNKFWFKDLSSICGAKLRLWNNRC